MAIRAIWTGTISFGMVSIPVRLYSATESQDVRFHLLHKGCGARLKNVRWCPVHEKAIAWEDTERGFEYAKGKYVPISEEELDRLPVKTVHGVDISDFVRLEEVDPIYFDRAYYLAPDANGAKAFVLLRRALEETGRAAVAKVAIRDRESLCLVRPYGDILTLETMFYANEIRATRDLENAAPADVKLSPKELQMAVSLIENLSDEFDITKYEDEYERAIKQLIEAKLKGKPLPPAPQPSGGEVIDLMEALRASIEASKKSGTGSTRKPAPTARTTPTARPAATTRRRRKSA
ncbi:MAG TPA: Ku protein [Candidatus Limnocylindrales bacterium]|nr:Ku protein [Candidatus Limnocylindrales bacterium]